MVAVVWLQATIVSTTIARCKQFGISADSGTCVAAGSNLYYLLFSLYYGIMYSFCHAFVTLQPYILHTGICIMYVYGMCMYVYGGRIQPGFGHVHVDTFKCTFKSLLWALTFKCNVQ